MIGAFQATDIGQYGIGDLTWWQGGGFNAFQLFQGGSDSQNPYFQDWGYGGGPTLDALGDYARTFESPAPVTTRAPVPAEDIRVIGTPEGILLPADLGNETVVPQGPAIEEPVMHPPTPSILDTIPDFEPYVEEKVAIDWGELAVGIFDTAAGIYSGQTQRDYISGLVGGGSGPPPVQTVGPGGPPRTVTVDTVTGKVTPCRRRRRRRLLTSSDLADLASLKAIVGGGAAMNAAVVKAVRR